MSRFRPDLTRSTVVFSAFFILLTLGLYALYESPAFEENPEPLFLIGLFVVTSASFWLGQPGAIAIVNIIVSPIRRYGLRAVLTLIALALGAFIVVARY